MFLKDPVFITLMRWAGKFGAAAMFAHIYVHTPEFFPTNLRGKGLGIPDGFSRGVAMVTPFFGMLYREHTFWYWILHVCLAVACIVVTFFMPETKDIMPDDKEQGTTLAQQPRTTRNPETG